MIYDTLDHLEAYRGVHPGVMRGLELLRDTDFSQWEDPQTVGWNCFLLTLIGLGILAAVFAVAGTLKRKKRV